MNRQNGYLSAGTELGHIDGTFAAVRADSPFSLCGKLPGPTLTFSENEVFSVKFHALSPGNS